MDHAVALVQAYLHVNGYFTVTEYPVIEALHSGKHKALTDLDVLAFRFPHAGALVPSKDKHGGKLLAAQTDPLLEIEPDQADMVIAEVKEGQAELNRGARNPDVLRAALVRFGCCSASHVDGEVRDLLRFGKTRAVNGHLIRLMAFGATGVSSNRYHVITLGHVIDYLSRYLDKHWQVLHTAQFKDPGFGLLMTMEKARRAGH